MQRECISTPFHHPATGIPVVFVFDAIEELIRMEPQDVSRSRHGGRLVAAEVAETALLCSAWGRHSCGSLTEAARIITDRCPAAKRNGVHFFES